MDPITIIGLVASVTNLIHASKSVLQVIKTFKDGNKQLHDLSNEISVFAEALAGFERVLRSRATLHRISGPVIESVLENSLDTVRELELRLVQISSSEHSAVRRAKWVQNASVVNKLHERLKEQNAMLQTFLSITHAETFLAVASQYPQYMLLSSSAAEEKTMEDKGKEESARLQVPQLGNGSRPLSIASSLSTVESISDTASSMESLSIVSSATSFGSSSSSASLPRESPHHKASNDSFQVSSRPLTAIRKPDKPLHRPSEEYSRGDSQDTLEVRQSCRYDCHCKCHEPDRIKPRRGFTRFKGVKVQCTDPTCRSNLASEKNLVGQSTSFRNALSQVMSSKSIKIRYDLNTYRMVPEGSDALRYVKHGNLEKLKACITSGEATIWDTAPDGWSLLHTAAYNRQLPIVKYLLELGIDTEVGDVGSRKPADLAILKSIGQDATDVEQDIVEIFSQKDDYLIDFEFSPIHIAVLDLYDTTDLERPSLEKGRKKRGLTRKRLIQTVDDANNAPTNTDWVAWKRNFKGRSPLFPAIIEYFRAAAFEKPRGSKIIHNLLDRADKKYSWTPLHWAASAGRVEKMKVLVEHGADPLILSNLNASIIHAAAESKINRGLAGALEIWKRCSDQLDINQTNRWDETPLHVAAWSSSACVSLLLEVGADPGMREENGQVPLHCAGLSEHGPDRRKIVSLLCGTQRKTHINTQDLDGRPPIFDFLDDPECVKVLIQQGARLDVTDDLGNNVFHHTCMQDEGDTLTLMLRLADATRAATEKNHDGNTPLIEALCNSSVECAMILLELEDVGDIIGKDGWAAVHHAAKIGDPDLLAAVFEHPSFIKGMKTMQGKRVDVVAMEAGNWHGKMKELIREHDYLGWRE